MATEAMTAIRKPIFPYSVRLDEDLEGKMAEIRGATGASPSDIFRRGLNLEYARWKKSLQQ
jgi:hypothetical protein